MDVAILSFDGVDEMDVVGPYEVFARAKRSVAGLTVRIASVHGEAQITGANGLRFATSGQLGTQPNVLVVTGGGWIANDTRGVRAEIERGVLPRLIAGAHARGATVAGVCTGAMAIAAAGLLRNRSATTHRAAIGDLRAAGARIVDAHVVDDGNVLTCGGVTHGIDLALWLVERSFGSQVAQGIATVLEYRRSSSVWVSESTLAAMAPADRP